METIITMLISALMIVESDGIANAIGDSGRAVGVLQITPVCVQDINRFSNVQYTLADRTDERKSMEMCWRYLYHYGNIYKRDTGKEPTTEILARIWNGGPRGYNDEKTRCYWAKVQAELQRQRISDQIRLRHRRIITHSASDGTRAYHIRRQ